MTEKNNNYFMQDISLSTWKDKYGLSGEGPIDNLERVAIAVSDVEKTPELKEEWKHKFLELFLNKYFFGAGRIMANAGAYKERGNASLINCTTLPLVPDSIVGMHGVQSEAVRLLAAGCGVGYNFSMIRPDGAAIKGLGAHTSGVVSFMQTFDKWCSTIMSAGGRRGAQMGVLDVQHPEIEEYITAKREDGMLRNFNLSIGMHDHILEKMYAGEDVELWHWEKIKDFRLGREEVNVMVLEGDDMPYYYPDIKYFRFGETHAECVHGDRRIEDTFRKKVSKVIKGGDLYELIMQSTYDYSEPGILNLTAINEMNPLRHLEVINQTNPCGEQPLPGRGSCLLGSMLLVSFIRHPFTDDAYFDSVEFYKAVGEANRFLDNIVEINKLPVKEYDDSIKDKRRHGLGITGLGSALHMLGLQYGSKEARDIFESIMGDMARSSYAMGILLAQEKGCAPALMDANDRYNYVKSPYFKDIFGADSEILNQFENDVIKYGIRYTHAISIAPTGTLSFTWGDNCSNGIEPIFSYGYMRNIRVTGRNTKVQEGVYDVSLLKWRELNPGTNIDFDNVPDSWIANTADSLTYKNHIDMQAIAQRYVDSAVSKTINVPTETPYEEFKDIYKYAFNSGLKGCTTFRFNPETLGAVLVTVDDLKATKYRFTTSDGKIHTYSGEQMISYKNEETTAGNLFDALKEGLYGKM